MVESKRLLTVGVAGLGNCGGQLANLAAKYGFNAVAINASSKDLDLLSEDVTVFPIGDGKGTGKNRQEAKDFFMSQLAILKDDEFIKFIVAQDIVVVATSTGGGFGSGASLVLVDALCEIYPDKLIIPAGVLPFDDEGYTAQDHTVEWLQELREINKDEEVDTVEKMSLSYLLYDNNRFSGKTQKQVCDIVNEQFIKDLMVMSGDYVSETTTGGTDERDIMTCLSTPGRIIIDALDDMEESDVIEDSLIATSKSHIKKESAHADMAEDKEIMASTVMYSLDDTFDAYKPSIKADLQAIFGEHISDYSNFSDEAAEDGNSFAIILAGLSDPTLRIDKIINRRQKMEDDILGRKKASSKLNAASKGNSKLKLGAKSFAGSVSTSASNTDAVMQKLMQKK